MKKICLCLLLLIMIVQFGISATGAKSSANSTAKTEHEVQLYVFQKNNKWGYMDRHGNVIIKPVYDLAWQFSDGLALIAKYNGEDLIGSSQYKYGYIDTKGNIKIPVIYDNATSFKNGNAVIEKLSKDQYDEFYKLPVGTRYWIKPNGKYFLKEEYLDVQYTTLNIDIEPFSNGLALVTVSGNLTSTKYINKKGEVVLDGYDGGGSFSEGLAAVYNYGNYETMWSDPDYKAGFINIKGEMVIEQKYDYVGSFSEGLAPVEIGRKWGYIDQTGKTMIPFQFDDAEPFHDGIAQVKMNGAYGFIDKQGNYVIQPQYRNVGDCYHGLIMVYNSEGKYMYYIDKNNQKVEAKI